MNDFDRSIERIFDCRGITEADFYKLLSDNTVLTDIAIFSISRMIGSPRTACIQVPKNIMFTKYIGETEIRPRVFGPIMDYLFLNQKGEAIADIELNFNSLSLHVSFPRLQMKFPIRNDLLDFDSDLKDKVMVLRMQVLNEILTRYYSKLLYCIYKSTGGK